MTDQAIQRMIDETEIRNVIARLAMATDRGDLEEYASLFAEDAVLEMRSPPGQPSVVPPSKGRAVILAGSQKRRADKIAGPDSDLAHAVQASAIKVTGDKATAQTYVVLYKNVRAKPDAVSMKIYNDEFVRTREGWKLAIRYIDPV
jgi:hypothetical protein